MIRRATPMSEFALRFRQVSKRYKSTAVLSEVSFDVQRGECFALAGVNGAGKTSLIKCALDFVHLDGGEIEICDVGHRQTRARATLAYLPERFSPPYFLSGDQFLDYMAKLQETDFSLERRRAMLQALDLDVNALDKTPRQLSKGMAQKLGLAACLLSGKQLYILDEPLSGLDPRARASVKHLLLKLKAEGKTVFFTSHSLADVAEVGDRMAILHDGTLRFVGPPDTLIHSYGADTLEIAFLRCIG